MLLSAGFGLAGGALAARVAEFRVVLLPLSVVLLGLGYYLAYWRQLGPRRHRVVLWLATAVIVLSWLAPQVVGLVVG